MTGPTRNRKLGFCPRVSHALCFVTTSLLLHRLCVPTVRVPCSHGTPYVAFLYCSLSFSCGGAAPCWRLQRVVSLVGRRVDPFVPAVNAMLKPALAAPHLTTLACAAWLTMLRLCSEAVLASHLSATVVSMLALFPLHAGRSGPSERDAACASADARAAAHALLRYLLVERGAAFRGLMADIPCVPELPELADVAQVVHVGVWEFCCSRTLLVCVFAAWVASPSGERLAPDNLATQSSNPSILCCSRGVLSPCVLRRLDHACFPS